jgi:hypothetical protein
MYAEIAYLGHGELLLRVRVGAGPGLKLEEVAVVDIETLVCSQ